MHGAFLEGRFVCDFCCPKQPPPRNGTPEQCWNDQVHKVILQELHDALRELVGETPVLRLRPRDRLSLRRGGVYRTESNMGTGPTPYLYVAALVAKWEAFPQTTLLATAVRLNYLSKVEAAKLLGDNVEAVCARLFDLQQRQDMVKKFGVRLHDDQDFSGTVAASSGVQAAPQKEVDIIRKHAGEESRLKRKLLPEANTLLMAPEAPRSSDEEVNAYLHLRRDASAVSSMLAVATNPHSGNVDNIVHFRKALAVMLGSTDTWKRQRRELQQDAVEWHFVKLREGYAELVADGDSRVMAECTNASGALRKLTLSRFIWDILRALHHKTPQEKEKFARIFVGDFKAKSLNPTPLQARAGLYFCIDIFFPHNGCVLGYPIFYS